VKSSASDIQLIDRVVAGDSSACRDLVDRHKQYAFTIAFRILRNRENAEEAAQDAFMQAFRNLSSFNRESKFTTWFYRIVFNAALMAKRREKPPGQDLDTIHGLSAEGGAAEETKSRERQFYLDKAMRLLQPTDSAVLTLYYMKEHSLEEIAEITGMSASNAKVRLHRARQRMAVELDGLLKTEARDLL
jgi:RNA polymerase sigma factor (sigma-70 family)